MNNNCSSIKKGYSKISMPYYFPIKKKNSRLHTTLFLNHGIKNHFSTEHSSNSFINKSNQNTSDYNNLIFDFYSFNKEKNILPKIEQFSFNMKTPKFKLNYINSSSTKNISMTKSNILKIVNLCNESNENNNCKIIKIKKNEKLNKFILDKSKPKRKISSDLNMSKKLNTGKNKKNKFISNQ